MADRLSAVAREFETRQRVGMGCRDQPADPELDQFMVLINYLPPPTLVAEPIGCLEF